MIEIPTLTCLRCDHRWVPRRAQIFNCPKCKSAHWDQARRKTMTPAQKKEYHNLFMRAKKLTMIADFAVSAAERARCEVSAYQIKCGVAPQ